MDLTFSDAEVAEDFGDDDDGDEIGEGDEVGEGDDVGEGDGDLEGEGDGDGDGEGDILQEEDEGRDSGGYYEDEEPEGEPYESQPASDSGHSMPDFTADVDIQKSDMMSEEENKSGPPPEETAEHKQGDFQINVQYEKCFFLEHMHLWNVVNSKCH